MIHHDPSWSIMIHSHHLHSLGCPPKLETWAGMELLHSSCNPCQLVWPRWTSQTIFKEWYQTQAIRLAWSSMGHEIHLKLQNRYKYVLTSTQGQLGIWSFDWLLATTERTGDDHFIPHDPARQRRDLVFCTRPAKELPALVTEEPTVVLASLPCA